LKLKADVWEYSLQFEAKVRDIHENFRFADREWIAEQFDTMLNGYNTLMEKFRKARPCFPEDRYEVAIEIYTALGTCLKKSDEVAHDPAKFYGFKGTFGCQLPR
jgi:hypothetical protein